MDKEMITCPTGLVQSDGTLSIRTIAAEKPPMCVIDRFMGHRHDMRPRTPNTTTRPPQPEPPGPSCGSTTGRTTAASREKARLKKLEAHHARRVGAELLVSARPAVHNGGTDRHCCSCDHAAMVRGHWSGDCAVISRTGGAARFNCGHVTPISERSQARSVSLAAAAASQRTTSPSVARCPHCAVGRMWRRLTTGRTTARVFGNALAVSRLARPAPSGYSLTWVVLISRAGWVVGCRL